MKRECTLNYSGNRRMKGINITRKNIRILRYSSSERYDWINTKGAKVNYYLPFDETINLKENLNFKKHIVTDIRE